MVEIGIIAGFEQFFPYKLHGTDTRNVKIVFPITKCLPL